MAASTPSSDSSASRAPGLLTWLVIALGINGWYLWLNGDAHLFYVANLFGHIVAGIVAMIAGALALRRTESSWKSPARWIPLAVVSLCGVLLLLLLDRSFPIIHMVHAWLGMALGVICLVDVMRSSGAPGSRWGVAGLAALVLIAGSSWLEQQARDTEAINQSISPSSLTAEAMGGEDGPFFPSPVKTSSGELIPEEYFFTSQTCAEAGCHPDAYNQWESSAHHLSSFNNQWYRKSIEYMQEIKGTQAAQWCAGCHDPALLLTGQMNQPVEDFLPLRASQTGLACVACHSIRDVPDTRGNGGYEFAFPALHKYSGEEGTLMKTVHDYVVKLDPGPHRNAFLPPVMDRERSAVLCSSCHKVHLDEEVNAYRWVRGFNTYDNWQASGVSGEGARSFYQPEEGITCVDCHMPLEASTDAGHDGGFIRGHHFGTANTALPTAYSDSTQLNRVTDFLTSAQLQIDIFAVSEPEAPSAEAEAAPEVGVDQMATTFAVGPEAEAGLSGRGVTRQATPIIGGLVDGLPVLERGSSARIDVVIRSLGVGHFFPSGTVDAQEAWVEFKAQTPEGDILFWSGFTGADSLNSVDPSAHFYRSLMIDERGNAINKRNAFASRTAVYVNLLAPGSADIAHYRLDVPEDIGDEVILTAAVHYRKFNAWHTHFAYAGERAEPPSDETFSDGYDDGKFVFTADMAGVSGPMKEIPELPIVTMAVDSLMLKVVDRVDTDALNQGTRRGAMAWNDYGIGLFLEGDFHGAEAAFSRVTEIDPDYADGWINLARIYVQEGQLADADRVLERAEATRPGYHKTAYFRALLRSARGDYGSALVDLDFVLSTHPNDRVVRNRKGRVLYLSERFEEARAEFEQVLRIDSEDLMAHYNLALVFTATGDNEQAELHTARYERYKADESAAALARAYRQNHEHDNNESLAIHEHRSIHTQNR